MRANERADQRMAQSSSHGAMTKDFASKCNGIIRYHLFVNISQQHTMTKKMTSKRQFRGNDSNSLIGMRAARVMKFILRGFENVIQ